MKATGIVRRIDDLGSYCMAFPAADSTSDYVLTTVVLMGDDNEDERVKIRSNPEMLAIMDTLLIE